MVDSRNGVYLEAAAKPVEEGLCEETEVVQILHQPMVGKIVLGLEKRHKIAAWKHVQVLLAVAPKIFCIDIKSNNHNEYNNIVTITMLGSVTDWAPSLVPGPSISHVLAQHASPISVIVTI